MRTSFIAACVLILSVSITACASSAPENVAPKVVTVLVTTTPPPTQTPAVVTKIETVLVEVTPAPAQSAETNQSAPTATPAPADADTEAAKSNADESDTEFKYPPVTLSVPVNTESFPQDRAPLLKWESVGELAPDEYYEVTIMRTWQGEPYYAGSDWVKESQYLVPKELVHGTSDLGEYTWWVTVKRQTSTNASGGKVGTPLSPPSEKRTFVWK